jgi:hypothetical protein
MHSSKCEYEEVESRVVTIREIPPAEYDAMVKKSAENEQRAKELEEKCQLLENALKYGEVTSLVRQIAEYQAMSVGYLEIISKEMQIYRYSYEERQKGLELIGYLRSVADELEGLMCPGGANA